MYITMGTPKIELTVLTLSSTGANNVLAIKSQPKQKTEPPRKHMGVTISGFDVFKKDFTRWGTAIPTNDIGPAKAVTHAQRKLESNTSIIRNNLMLTPMFYA